MRRFTGASYIRAITLGPDDAGLIDQPRPVEPIERVKLPQQQMAFDEAVVTRGLRYTHIAEETHDKYKSTKHPTAFWGGTNHSSPRLQF